MDERAGTSPGGQWAAWLAACTLAVLCWAGPASASDTLPAGVGVQTSANAAALPGERSAELERWRGKSCPIGGCGPGPSGQVTTALAFGAAVGAIGWLSRRRGSSPS